VAASLLYAILTGRRKVISGKRIERPATWNPALNYKRRETVPAKKKVPPKKDKIETKYPDKKFKPKKKK
jgi:hypothetical protein